MIERIIKKMLRKWLKKKLYTIGLSFDTNTARFNWVYNSSLLQWRDRIWVAKNNPYSCGEYCDIVFNEYLNDK